MLLKIVLFAYSRGMLHSRPIEEYRDDLSATHLKVLGHLDILEDDWKTA